MKVSIQHKILHYDLALHATFATSAFTLVVSTLSFCFCFYACCHSASVSYPVLCVSYNSDFRIISCYSCHYPITVSLMLVSTAPIFQVFSLALWIAAFTDVLLEIPFLTYSIGIMQAVGFSRYELYVL